jgi:hypothetical protein
MKVAGDPFTPSERRYLISRLSKMEIDPRGLDCQVAKSRSAERHPKFPEAVQSLQARGFLAAAEEEGGTVMVLTSDGKAALRQLFLRQLVDHALLYPTLHRQLGVGGHPVNRADTNVSNTRGAFTHSRKTPGIADR